jgi:hypothetical protein
MTDTSYDTPIYREQGGSVLVMGNVAFVVDPNTDCLILLNVPTSDPHLAGAVWANNGVLTLSAGSSSSSSSSH